MATTTRAKIEIVGQDKTGAAFASLAGKLKGAQGGVAALASSFAGIQTIIATALGALGLSFVSQTIDAIDALNDVADATGATVENLSVNSENLSASRSRIMDADFAAETANLSRTQILQQAGTAMVAQANQLPQQVLKLLQG